MYIYVVGHGGGGCLEIFKKDNSRTWGGGVPQNQAKNIDMIYERSL